MIDTCRIVAGHGNWYHDVLHVPEINIYNLFVVSEITDWSIKDKYFFKISVQNIDKIVQGIQRIMNIYLFRCECFRLSFYFLFPFHFFSLFIFSVSFVLDDLVGIREGKISWQTYLKSA